MAISCRPRYRKTVWIHFLVKTTKDFRDSSVCKSVSVFSATLGTDVNSFILQSILLCPWRSFRHSPHIKYFCTKKLKYLKGEVAFVWHKMYFPRTYQIRYKWVCTMCMYIYQPFAKCSQENKISLWLYNDMVTVKGVPFHCQVLMSTWSYLFQSIRCIRAIQKIKFAIFSRMSNQVKVHSVQAAIVHYSSGWYFPFSPVE